MCFSFLIFVGRFFLFFIFFSTLDWEAGSREAKAEARPSSCQGLEGQA